MAAIVRDEYVSGELAGLCRLVKEELTAGTERLTDINLSIKIQGGRHSPLSSPVVIDDRASWSILVSRFLAKVEGRKKKAPAGSRGRLMGCAFRRLI